MRPYSGGATSDFMIFSSPRFFVFLAVVLAALAVPSRHETKKRILLVASCVFYAAWDYRYLALLLIVSIIDYYCAARIAVTDDATRRRGWVTFSVVSNLAILGYFSTTTLRGEPQRPRPPGSAAGHPASCGHRFTHSSR